MEKKRSVLSQAVVAGFALFAVFFGAGNLIFPPYLGMEAGHGWFKGFLCFVTADAGLALLTVLATVRSAGTMEEMLAPLGRIPARLLSLALVLCVGPLVAIPRTGATTYELGVKQLLPEIPPLVFGLLFFGVVALLTVRPTAVVDIIGRVLTPILLITLAVLCIKGILTPIGEIGPGIENYNVPKEGFLAGYQTMDALGAIPLTVIILKSVKQNGFRSGKDQMRVMLPGSLVAFLGLFAVYGGLCYLGATTSLMDMGEINQTSLVVTVTQILLKRFGVVLLGLIVLFACLTTAIGLTSSAADFFSTLLKKKVSYSTLVMIICGLGVAISNAGISAIIAVASPVLTVIYPIFLTQIILSFFSGTIRKKTVYRGAALGALIVSVLDTAAGLFGWEMTLLHRLPLASFGFAWLVPAVIGGVIGALIGTPEKEGKKNEDDLSGRRVLLGDPALFRSVQGSEGDGDGLRKRTG